MSPTNYDEIDLFELFKVLWDGKWLISTFMADSILVGGGFIFSKDQVYEAKLTHSVDTLPPFYDANKTLIDFHKKFFSFRVFEKWKQNNINSFLLFEYSSATEVVDGSFLSNNEVEAVGNNNIG